MNVKMNVGGETIEYDVKDELFFDIEHVFKYFENQAANIAWWWSLVAMKADELRDAKVDLDSMKADLDKLSARIELETRANQDSLAAQYAKVTEAVIKAVVTTHPLMAAKEEELRTKQRKINRMQRDKDLLTAMANGFDSRSVLLATAGSARKSEAQANLRQLTGKVSKATKEIAKK